MRDTTSRPMRSLGSTVQKGEAAALLLRGRGGGREVIVNLVLHRLNVAYAIWGESKAAVRRGLVDPSPPCVLSYVSVQSSPDTHTQTHTHFCKREREAGRGAVLIRPQQSPAGRTRRHSHEAAVRPLRNTQKKRSL